MELRYPFDCQGRDLHQLLPGAVGPPFGERPRLRWLSQDRSAIDPPLGGKRWWRRRRCAGGYEGGRVGAGRADQVTGEWLGPILGPV